jgi:hypothetical protein
MLVKGTKVDKLNLREKPFVIRQPTSEHEKTSPRVNLEARQSVWLRTFKAN